MTKRAAGRLPVLECCGPAPHDDDCPVWLAIKARLDAEWDPTPIEGHRPYEVAPGAPACCKKCGAFWPCDRAKARAQPAEGDKQ